MEIYRHREGFFPTACFVKKTFFKPAAVDEDDDKWYASSQLVADSGFSHYAENPDFFFFAYINIRLNFFQISLNTITLPFIPSLFRIPMDSSVALCCCTKARLAPRSMPFPAKCCHRGTSWKSPTPAIIGPDASAPKNYKNLSPQAGFLQPEKPARFLLAFHFRFHKVRFLRRSRRDVGGRTGHRQTQKAIFLAVLHRQLRSSTDCRRPPSRRRKTCTANWALWWVTKPPCLQSMALCTNE